MIESGDKAWIRARALNNALQKHPHPAVSQENHEGVFGATGKDREWLHRYAGIRRMSGPPDDEHLVDVLAVGLPYGKSGQRVGVHVATTLSDETSVEVVVHRRSVESTIEREARRGIREHEWDSLLAEITELADPHCKRCRGTGAAFSGRIPCKECTGVSVRQFFERLDSR